MKAFLTFQGKTVEVDSDFSLSEANPLFNFENIQLSRAKDLTINKIALYNAGFVVDDFSLFGGKSLIGEEFDAELQIGVQKLYGKLTFSGVKGSEISANFVYGDLAGLKAFKELKISDLDNTYDPDLSASYEWNNPTNGDFLDAGAVWAGSNNNFQDFGSVSILVSRLLHIFALKSGLTIEFPENEYRENLYIYASNQASVELYVATIPIAVKDVLKLEAKASDLLKIYAIYTASYVDFDQDNQKIIFKKIDDFKTKSENVEKDLISFDEKLKSLSDGVNRQLKLKNTDDFYYLPPQTAFFNKLLTPINYGDNIWEVDLATPIRCFNSLGKNFKDLIPIFLPEYTNGEGSRLKMVTNTWLASANYPIGDPRRVSEAEDTLVTAIPQNSSLLTFMENEKLSIKISILGGYERFLELKDKVFLIFGQKFVWKSAQISETLINFEIVKF